MSSFAPTTVTTRALHLGAVVACREKSGWHTQRSQWSWRNVLVVVGVLMGLGFAQQAQAGCGDYLFHSNKLRPGSVPGRWYDATTSGFGTDERSMPCDGPQCEHRESVPLPHWPIVSSPSPQDVMRADPLEPAAGVGCQVIPLDNRAHRAGYPLSLWRPPR